MYIAHIYRNEVQLPKAFSDWMYVLRHTLKFQSLDLMAPIWYNNLTGYITSSV